MKVEIIQTEDGSSSLFVPELNETYHSTHGAITESTHVYIENGLNHYIKTNQPNSINILEVGFGTGLNALLTAIFVQKLSVNIHYHTLETFPLEEKIVESLHYPSLVGEPDPKELFQEIHQAKWGELISISDKFSIHKINRAIEKFQNKIKYDLIYFDAFAPSKQPEMWEIVIFDRLYAMMNPKAVLVTYCAQGQFKRNLKSAGFDIESLAGPPKKFEMVRAIKQNDLLRW